MKAILPCFLCLFSVLVYGQDYNRLVGEANDNYNKKNYTKSAMLYKQAFKLEQKRRSDFYNAACSAALIPDKKLALNWLSLAFDNGYVNIRHLKADTDLDALHNTTGWQVLVGKMQKKVNEMEKNYDKSLQNELLAIFDDDQKERLKLNDLGQRFGFDSKQVDALWKHIEKKDSINLLKIKSILDKYGWVGEEKVGPQANSTLFLVIQHADLTTQ